MLEFEGRELILQLRWLDVSPVEREIRAILAFDDVTETMGEIEFQRTVDRFSSVGELAAVIAHEIRNPLTGIRTTIQYVGSKLEGQSQLRSDLDDSIKELDRIEQFTTDLLQFARPKSMQLEEDDLTPILGKVLDHLDQHFKSAGISVKRELAENLPRIPIDPDAIQQVLLNMILNAIEAMPEGGQFRVSTSTRRYRSRQAVEVAFHDTGCGIKEDVLDKIFDPFFTTRPNGTGLGLSISLQIIKEHGGRINMRNRAGGGATFRLSFPVPVPSETEKRG
jgi:signal transduction histidine kinase